MGNKSTLDSQSFNPPSHRQLAMYQISLLHPSSILLFWVSSITNHPSFLLKYSLINSISLPNLLFSSSVVTLQAKLSTLLSTYTFLKFALFPYKAHSMRPWLPIFYFFSYFQSLIIITTISKLDLMAFICLNLAP